MSNTTAYNQTKFTNVQNDARIKIASKIIQLAQYLLRFYDICDYKENIGSGNGKTVRFIKYPDVNLPSSTITEGVDPAGQVMTNTSVEAIAEQWGDIIAITDVAELTIAHPVMAVAQERLARQAARTIDREIQNVLKTSTQIRYATNVAGRASLTTSTILGRDDVKAMVAKLRLNGAEPMDGEYYVGVIDPAVEQDLNTNDNFLLAKSYMNDGKPLFMGEIGMWLGVRWIRSNFMPVYTNNTTTSLTATVANGGDATGSLADATYYVKVVARAVTTDFETVIFAEQSQAVTSTATTDGSVKITLPSNTSYVYDIYAGSSSGATKLYSARNAASAVVFVQTIPTTTAAAPVTPANSVYVHTSYVFGKGAYAIGDMQNLQFHITKDESVPGNVLRLSRYAGWKVMFKTAILENSFMFRAESHSANI